MTTPKGPRLGSTLYAFTTEYHSRQLSFEDLVRKVAAEGIGPGLEVVGYQSIRGFPEVADEFADKFKALIEETGLTLSCLGINADIWRRPGVAVSLEQNVAHHVRQLEAAAKLGFPVVRFQYPAGPEAIRQLAPIAEKLGVKMGLEIHAPHHVQHPDVLAYREMYEKVGSPFLGFIPDFGASTRAVPTSFIEHFRASGIPEDAIELGLDHWNDEGEGHERRDRFFEAASKHNLKPEWIGLLTIMFGLFSRQTPEAWSEIMPQVVHIHGKFFDFDERGEELSVDYRAHMKVFVDGGYGGFMSSEYEGHMWTDNDGIDRVRRHHAHVSRILDELAAVQ